jgi:hypothetical protein
LKPRKFIYEEVHYFGKTYLIEWAESRLEIQDSTPCIPYLASPYWIKPTNEDWARLEKAILSLNLKPTEPEWEATDGMEVRCWITFKTKILRFHIINPDFTGFDELRELLNSFTTSDEYPDGLFKSSN